MMVAALALSAIAADAPGPAIRWVDDASGRTVAVEVAGIAPGTIDAASAADRLAVQVEGAAEEGPAMLGAYRVGGDVLRFEPRFPLDRGRRYRATFRPAPAAGNAPPADARVQEASSGESDRAAPS